MSDGRSTDDELWQMGRDLARSNGAMSKTKLRKAARGMTFTERLNYDRQTGIFTWRTNGGSRAREGSLAGSVNSSGYRVIRIGGCDFYAHRIAWFFEFGVMVDLIDHIDGNPSNNAISNLREATKSKNGANRGKQANNTSGFKGVTKHYRKWVAQIQVNGRNLYIGLFETPEEASAAYTAKASTIFGEFSRQ